MHKVAIIGAGNIGRAIGEILIKQGVDVTYFDKEAGKVKNQLPLEKALESKEAIFLCVPSWAIRETCQNIKPYLTDRTPVISLAKGLEHSTGLSMDRLLADELGEKVGIGVIGGPMLASELSKDEVAVGVIGSPARRVIELVEALFAQSQLTIYPSTDIRGIALSGVLKNIYAMGLGMSDGAHLGLNAKGYLITQATFEACEIISLLGGHKTTFLGPAGLGDMVATGSSTDSKNYQVGFDIAASGRFGHCEGIGSLPPLISLLGVKAKNYPLLDGLRAIVLEKKSPALVLSNRVTGRS